MWMGSYEEYLRHFLGGIGGAREDLLLPAPSRVPGGSTGSPRPFQTDAFSLPSRCKPNAALCSAIGPRARRADGAN